MLHSRNSESKSDGSNKVLEQQEFKKKRDEYVIEIRKQKREETLNKKRFTNLEMEKKLPSSKNSNIYANKSEESQLDDLISLWRQKVYRIEQLPDIIQAFNSPDIFQQNYAVIALRRLLSTAEKPPIQDILDNGLVPRLISFTYRDEEPNLQLESTWALTNIASGTTHQTQSIIDKKGIPAIIRLLKSDIPEISEQAIWAIGNICGDSSQFRDIILKEGALDPLIYLIESTKDERIVKYGAWALSNLVRGKPEPKFEKVFKAIPTLVQVLIESEEYETLMDAAWGLAHLSDGKDKLEIVLQSDIGTVLQKHLESDILNIQIPIIRVAGNILSGSVEHANKLLESSEVVDVFFKLLEHNHRTIRRESAWCLSNITAGNEKQIELVIGDYDRIKKIIAIIETDYSENVKECLWIFSNATNKSNNLQIAKMVEAGVLKCFCNLLTSPDPKILEIVLDGILNMLSCGARLAKEAGGENKFLLEFEAENALKEVEGLQTHQSYFVYTKALKILETFYDIEDAI